MIKKILSKISGLTSSRLLFLDWDEYKQRIDYLDAVTFQQQVRAASIKNMQGCGQ